MKFIKVGNRVINPQLMAWAVRQESNGPVEIHFPVPRAAVVTGATYPRGSVPPAASDHYYEVFHGDDADEVWKQLQDL